MSSKRRNGQLSSCEPCRKAKLRCDHATPICGRCIQRQQADMCIYHPAPLTRPKLLENSSPLPKKRKRDTSIVTEKGITSTNLLLKYRIPPPTPADSIEEDESLNERLQPKIREIKEFPTGFLGPSSYWATFDEPDESRLLCVTRASTDPSDTSPETIMDSTLVDSEQIEGGARILSLLDDLPLYLHLIFVRYEHCEPWVFGRKLALKLFTGLNELRAQWQQGSKNKNSQTKLLAWSRKIFDNSTTPIKVDRYTTVSEYFSQITLRWETIGLMFTWVGLATTTIPSHHESFRLDDGTVIDKHELYTLVIDVVELCLGFCDSLGTMSDPLSWLLLQHTVLLAEGHGDTNYRPWRKLGDLSTMVFALGLHRPETDPHIPFFLGEIRRRVMVASYSLDKQLATLLGRPPRIAWQYCDIKFPLDLNYDDIFPASDNQEEESILAKIGHDGWNIDGRITSGSKARMHLMFGLIREKILALSLSPHPEDVAQKISETCAEYEHLRSNLPPVMQWRPSHFSGSRTMDQHTEFVANMHLEFLNNDFILYRVLVKRTGKGKEKLLKVAREMLAATLAIVSRNSQTRDNCDSIWNLCYIGLPCAGVLARELLQRSQQQYYRSLHEKPPKSADTMPFPRSEVIQNLSVFAANLENVLGSRGNFGISQKGLNVIRNVLDRVLSGDEMSCAPSNLPPPTGDELTAVPLELPTTLPELYSDDGNTAEFMTWLDNIDWAQEALLSYS
ncbi:hypothetical protein BGW36DRAFT_379643 [Talaromyces proteolyticus]|uniref:Zn(2)-C6 fungal-type domain-containing protein n=1 Tax=Talaromyces proteolyticus TaxID=1131652 RepID=A0AAD4Q134_9EURO|nr:uncharacterized protein BGW36DRAFT_379643 [Talaromyces proteolyticus]KAH8697906.1 hypothetical protein BGW36DRAFT_379643 [Talaromyces proteolyticus]